MTREELEAVVREQLTRVVANALQSGVPSAGMFNRATETILGGAESYAATEVGLLTPAERRRVLHGATAPHTPPAPRRAPAAAPGHQRRNTP